MTTTAEKKRAAVAATTDAGDDAPDLDTTEDMAEAEIEALSSLLPEGSKGTLYRLLDGADKELCDTIFLADFDLAKVHRDWGGGRYMLFLLRPNKDPKGRRWLPNGSRRFRLAGPARQGPTAAVEVSTTAAAEAGALRTYNEMMQAGMRQMLEGASTLQTLQMAVIKNLTDRPPDTTHELLKTMLPALIGRPVPAGTNLTELITVAKMLNGGTSGLGQLKETVRLIAELRELGGGESGERGPAWMGVASKALDTIGKALTRGAEEPAPDPAVVGTIAPGTTAPAAAPSPAPSSPPARSVVPESAHPLFRFLEEHMPMLMRQARMNNDPTTYAGLIFDLMPREHHPDIRATVATPTFMAELEQLFPAIGTTLVEGMTPPTLIRGWFEELRDDLVARIDDDAAPEEDDQDDPE